MQVGRCRLKEDLWDTFGGVASRPSGLFTQTPDRRSPVAVKKPLATFFEIFVGSLTIDTFGLELNRIEFSEIGLVRI